MTKILIADDNRQISSVLAEYSKREGYAPIVAEDGEEAMENFREFDPDIILLDVMMPVKDGFEVCREIRRESNVPIIMITARGEDFEKIMGLDIGADAILSSPFLPERSWRGSGRCSDVFQDPKRALCRYISMTILS